MWEFLEGLKNKGLVNFSKEFVGMKLEMEISYEVLVLFVSFGVAVSSFVEFILSVDFKWFLMFLEKVVKVMFK